MFLVSSHQLAPEVQLLSQKVLTGVFPVGTIFSGASSVSTSAVKLLGFFKYIRPPCALTHFLLEKRTFPPLRIHDSLKNESCVCVCLQCSFLFALLFRSALCQREDVQVMSVTVKGSNSCPVSL